MAAETPSGLRFSIGLLVDVRDVLVQHGYPKLDGPGLVELRQHLFHLLHGEHIGDGQCSGKTLAAVSPSLDGEAPPEDDDDVDTCDARHPFELLPFRCSHPADHDGPHSWEATDG